MKFFLVLFGLACSLNAATATCPTTIENDPAATGDGCGILMNVGLDLKVSATETGTLAYNGSDSTFGITNSSTRTILSLLLTGGDITAFTGNGITTYISANGVVIPPTPPIVFGYESYYGPSTTFSQVDYAGASLLVTFTGGLLPGVSTYFSLPGTPTDDVNGLTAPGGVITANAASSVPEPATALLGVTGLVFLGWIKSRSHR